MLTIETLQEKRKKYQDKADYFGMISFDNLKADFSEIVTIIDDYVTSIGANAQEVAALKAEIENLKAAVQSKDPEAEPAQEGENNARV